MTESTNGSFSEQIGRLSLWVFGSISLVMAISIDDGSVKLILRMATAVFCFGLLMSMTLKRLLPNWRTLFWTTLVVAAASGLVAAGVKLYELLEVNVVPM